MNLEKKLLLPPFVFTAKIFNILLDHFAISISFNDHDSYMHTHLLILYTNISTDRGFELLHIKNKTAIYFGPIAKVKNLMSDL